MHVEPFPAPGFSALFHLPFSGLAFPRSQILGLPLLPMRFPLASPLQLLTATAAAPSLPGMGRVPGSVSDGDGEGWGDEEQGVHTEQPSEGLLAARAAACRMGAGKNPGSQLGVQTQHHFLPKTLHKIRRLLRAGRFGP